MKVKMLIITLIFSALHLSAQQTLKITYLEPAQVIVGGKDLKKGDSFSSKEVIQWSSPNQIMKVFDARSGKIKIISAADMKNLGHKTALDYLTDNKRLSAREVEVIGNISNITKQEKQGGSFEVWAQQKRDEYDRWKKLRAEIVSHLPANPNADKISNFIDAGFDDKPSAPQTIPSSSHSSPLSQQSQQSLPKTWVVVAGVAEYAACCRKNNDDEECSGVSCLNYTDDDAYKIYAFYKSTEGGSLPDNQINVLIDEEATQASIIAALQTVYANAGANDAIIFYFSGHGSESAFVAQDYAGKYNSDNTGLLFHKEINRIFENARAKYKYIIVDACHSGNLAKQYYQAFENKDIVMLLSSMGEEISMESGNIRQGIFSHYLLRGLKGEADTNKDGIVSITELYDFVKANVVKATGSKQNPVIFGKYSEAMPVSILKN